MTGTAVWNGGDGTLTWTPDEAFATEDITADLTVVDTFGNTNAYGSITFTNVVDNEDPVIGAITPANGTLDNDKTINFTAVLTDTGGADIDDAASTITVTGAETGAVAGVLTWNAGTNTLTFDPNADLAEDNYTVVVTAVDNAGNTTTNGPAGTTFALDLTSPVISSITPANLAKICDNTKPTISAVITDAFSSVDTGSTIITLQSGLTGYGLTAYQWDGDTVSTIPNIEVLPDGVYNLAIYAYDAAGNETISNTTFTVETVPAVITPGAPTVTEQVSSTRVTNLSATSDDPIDWTVTVQNPNGVTVATFTADDTATFGPQAWGPSDEYQPSGTYTIYYNGIDDAGNPSVEKSNTVEVYNYPIEITQVRVLDGTGNADTTFVPGQSYQIEATIENLGPDAEAPMLIVQVEDPDGEVINIGTVKLSTFANGATITLTSGATLANSAVVGDYSVDVKVWSGWTAPEILSQAYADTTAFSVSGP
jgi:hypothetical protein